MKTTTLKKSSQTEKQVVASCRTYLKKQGWVTKLVYTGGIPIGFGKLAANPCKGIPDCLAFHVPTQTFLWIEFKKGSGGILSEEQMAFHALLRSCGQTVLVTNSLATLKAQLNEIAIMKLVNKPDWVG
jgi:hypothetical protein